MLNLLQIRNFAIIESLDLDFCQGFTAITGETGAGKSILVDALSLILGNRADSGSIRAGSEKAELTAEFDLEQNPDALEWLRDSGLDDDSNCLLRRIININGRSRAWINGTTVTLSQLQQLGERLVEIHGQNEHIRLVRPDEQFRLLDADTQCASRRSELIASFQQWEEVEKQLAALEQEAPLAAGELDLLKFQIEELESVALDEAAYHALETEHRLLARGSDVVVLLESSLKQLDDEQAGLGLKVQQLVDELQSLTDLDPDIANARKTLEEAAINCEEARSSLQSALSRTDLSPERLVELEQSMGRLHELSRKHRVEPGKLPGVAEELHQRCERANSLEQRKQELRKKQVKNLADYRSHSLRLHKIRKSRSASLSRGVTDLMQILGMEGGVFEFQVINDKEANPSKRGDDTLNLLVSANPGVPPAPLKKVASGGELSRISLAVKVASAEAHFVTTQVFDEVDAGIGGETANSVGRLLQSVAANGQALCVTHLAQVAVCADQQFRVLKNAGENMTQVETSLLDQGERVDEIARMLGGHISDQSRAHATELLANALTQH
jgi:DNA repair protein RecN (Recombination protein N)